MSNVRAIVAGVRENFKSFTMKREAVMLVNLAARAEED